MIGAIIDTIDYLFNATRGVVDAVTSGSSGGYSDGPPNHDSSRYGGD